MNIGLLGNTIFSIFISGNIFLVLGSVLAGIVIGAVPGLTSTMAIGLLVPLTFSFSKEVAFMLLIGIYIGGIYGGSITACLMNLPGTPTAAVTAIDGYPLTKQGKGGLAVGIATMASSIGGLISGFFLILLSLKLSEVAILFSGPEYFSLGLLAICVVFSLSSKSIVKGLLAMVLGLILSTVGFDQVAGFPRFTFGIQVLSIGVPTVPAIIGMFCVSEAFRMAEVPGVIKEVHKNVSGFWLAYRELPKLWLTIIKSSLIGLFTGILPGIGATMASFLAYAEAKRVSKKPEKFGNGSVEGVCASEAANNAVCGGALIPALTLGIPGDTNTLLLLGAMMVHGLVPGPTLFREEINLVYLIFGTFIIDCILILPLGLFLAKHISRIALIPKKYLMPVVAVLAITGASIGYGHIYYLWISIIFGFLGYIMKKGGFPVLATGMALILGPLIERNLRAALMLPETRMMIFFSRPISLFFILLSIVIVVFAIFAIFKKKPDNY